MAYNLENFRVLVVDDNMPIRMLIRMLLLDLGVGQVDMAADGLEGLELYHTLKPDIVMVDWRMDKMDGLTFAKTLRQSKDSAAQHVPILMMAGFSHQDKATQAQDAGITDLLIKPFTVETLVEHIGQAIEKSSDPVQANDFESAPIPLHTRRADKA